MSPASSSRWCPTPEQLMILEELYRIGVRTPNASQIQRITAHLSMYGKIVGKNVFYWFQNHKARDRQKLRKKLTKQLQEQQQHHQHVDCPCDLPNQLLIEQDQSNHHFLLKYFDPTGLSPSPPSSLAFHQLPYHNYSPGFPSAQMDQTWKVEIPPRITEDSNIMMKRSMYGHDWMMMMSREDVGPISSFCTNVGSSTTPLKTLELFPIKSTNLKEECNPSLPSKHLSCLTPFTN